MNNFQFRISNTDLDRDAVKKSIDSGENENCNQCLYKKLFEEKNVDKRKCKSLKGDSNNILEIIRKTTFFEHEHYLYKCGRMVFFS